MIKWILIIGLAAALWVVWGKYKAQTAEKEVQQNAATYSRDMDHDVKQAEDIANTANNKIQQDAKSVDDALSHSQ